MKYKRIFIIIIIGSLIYGVYRWNDYREKNLADVIEANEVTEMYFNIRPINEKLPYNRKISEEISIKEFEDFLTKYTVKKTGDLNFTSKFPDEQFSFQLEYSDGRITMPILLERNVALIGMYQFDIVNGPVDYEWLSDFLAEHGESM